MKGVRQSSNAEGKGGSYLAKSDLIYDNRNNSYSWRVLVYHIMQLVGKMRLLLFSYYDCVLALDLYQKPSSPFLLHKFFPTFSIAA